MAIVFIEKRKLQRYLIFVLIMLVSITVLVLWKGFFVKPKLEYPKEVFKPVKKVEIDFEVLKNPILEKLQPFEGFPPIGPEIEIGRKNPFLPY